MDSKLRDSAGHRPGELKIYLLWRHALREAVFLASQLGDIRRLLL